MKNGIRKATALVLALMLMLSTCAFAAKETPSKAFKLPTIKYRTTPAPEVTVEPTVAPETNVPEAPVAPEATVAPVEPQPTMPVVTDTPVEDVVIAKAVVTLTYETSNVNVRAGAGTDTEAIGYLLNGAEVSVLGYEGEWTKVETADGLTGYVKSSYLTEAAAEEEVVEEPVVEELPVLEEELVPASYSYERDENGNLVLDENGNPVAIIPDGMEVPIDYVRDENGNLVLDENGDPIVLNSIPEGANKIVTLQDELNPDRYIDIYAVWQDETPEFNEEMTLISVIYGYDNIQYTIQWQHSVDDVNWSDIEGATDGRYTFTVTEENYTDYWRVSVIMTGVIVED